MKQFISGAVMMGFAVVGAFFFRFWRKTGDKLFAFFAASFWILAIERIPLILTDTTDEARTYVYLIRLSAFVLILLGILDKNRSTRSAPPTRRERQTADIG